MTVRYSSRHLLNGKLKTYALVLLLNVEEKDEASFDLRVIHSDFIKEETPSSPLSHKSMKLTAL